MDVVQPRSYSSAYAAAVELLLVTQDDDVQNVQERKLPSAKDLAQADPSGTSQKSKVFALGQLQGRGASDFDQLPSLARSWRLHFSCGLDAQALQLLLHLRSKVPAICQRTLKYHLRGQDGATASIILYCLANRYS